MTITLDLPDGLERRLAVEAAQLGVPLTEYAVELLTAASPPTSPPVTDGASLVEYWEREGLIGSRPDITDPAAYARKLREEPSQRLSTDHVERESDLL